jgi:hypothetical protein
MKYNIYYQQGGNKYLELENYFPRYRSTSGGFLGKFPFTYNSHFGSKSVVDSFKLDFTDLHLHGNLWEFGKAYRFQYFAYFLEHIYEFDQFGGTLRILPFINLSNIDVEGNEDNNYNESLYLTLELISENYMSASHLQYYPKNMERFGRLRNDNSRRIMEYAKKYYFILFQIKKYININLFEIIDKTELKYFLSAYCKLKILEEKFGSRITVTQEQKNNIRIFTDKIDNYIYVRSKNIYNKLLDFFNQYLNEIHFYSDGEYNGDLDDLIENIYPKFRDGFKDIFEDLNENKRNLIPKLYSTYDFIKKYKDLPFDNRIIPKINEIKNTFHTNISPNEFSSVTLEAIIKKLEIDDIIYIIKACNNNE